MRKFLGSMLERLAAWLNKKPQQEDFEKLPIEESLSVVHEQPTPKVSEKPEKANQKKTKEVVQYPEKPIRDIIDLMEFPFVALSKNRRTPLIYESADGTQKIKITRHTDHFLASIYDWDIILIVAGKIQELLNNGSDIPSRKVVIPRHDLLKSLQRGSGKKQQQDLEKSLDRLQLTGISTTVNNKDTRHRGTFGFIESWRYSERKNDRDTKIIQITLSDWLFELCCIKGSLLKSNSLYFKLSSGLHRFLYRTARKHAGNNKDGWEFSIEKLYEKSGSEQEFKKFKSDLKKAVFSNTRLPDYHMKWIDRDGNIVVSFKKRSRLDEIDMIVSKHEEITAKFIENNEVDVAI
jgi:plasmid replication initiation protein